MSEGIETKPIEFALYAMRKAAMEYALDDDMLGDEVEFYEEPAHEELFNVVGPIAPIIEFDTTRINRTTATTFEAEIISLTEMRRIRQMQFSTPAELG